MKYAAEAATAAETPAVIAVTTAVILALDVQACSTESSVDSKVAADAKKLLVVQHVTLAATVAVDAKSKAVQFESIPLTDPVGGTFGSGRQVNRTLQPHSGQDSGIKLNVKRLRHKEVANLYETPHPAAVESASRESTTEPVKNLPPVRMMIWWS